MTKMLARVSVAMVVLIAFVACSSPTVAGDAKVTARYGESARGTINGLPLLVLRGTPSQRGQAQGFLCAREIILGISEYIVPVCEQIARKKKGGSYETVIIPATRAFNWPADAQAEIKGILEGVQKALPDKKDRIIKSLGREISLDDLKAANCLADLMKNGCSSFAAWGKASSDGNMIVGRNLDYKVNDAMLALQCIMAVEPADKGLKPTLGVSWMSSVGSFTVMNSDGVFVAIHDARGRSRSRKNGWTPRSIALRKVAQTVGQNPIVADSAKLLRNAPVRVGNAILVCGRPDGKGDAQAATMEWDGNLTGRGVTVRPPAKGRNWLVTTNHYVSRKGASRGSSWSNKRWNILNARLKGSKPKKIDIAQAKAMMNSVASDKRLTVHSVVAQPDKRRMFVALAPDRKTPATKGEWKEVVWDDVFNAAKAGAK